MFPLRRVVAVCSFRKFRFLRNRKYGRLRLFEPLEGRQTVHVTEVYVTGVERFSPLRISIRIIVSATCTLIQLAGVRLIKR